MSIKAGDRIEARAADGQWYAGVACSDVEPERMMRGGRYRKVHDFPVIWVVLDGGKRDDFMPWPADSVRRDDRRKETR